MLNFKYISLRGATIRRCKYNLFIIIESKLRSNTHIYRRIERLD